MILSNSMTSREVDASRAEKDALLLPHLRDRGALIAATLVIGILSLSLNIQIERRLDNLGVFDQYDVLFHSDPLPNLQSFVTGDFDARKYQNFVHPIFIILIYPLIDAGAAIVSLSEGADWDASAARRELALLISPISSALKSICVFWIMIGLGLSLTQAGLLSLLSIISFSQIIFGSTPESFPVSGLLLAVGYLLTIRSHRSGSRAWHWVLLSVIAAGVTITNTVAIALLYACTGYFSGKRPRTLLLEVVALMGITALVVGGVARGLDSVPAAKKLTGYVALYVWAWSFAEPPYVRAAAFPTAVVNTIAAARPLPGENETSTRDRAKYAFMMSFKESPSVFSLERPFGLSLLALIVAGAVGCRRGPPIVKCIGVASAAIIGFNWALHSIWGVEFFLYSQHWHVSILALLAGLFFYSDRAKPYLTTLLALMLIVVVVENLQAMEAIWAELAVSTE